MPEPQESMTSAGPGQAHRSQRPRPRAWELWEPSTGRASRTKMGIKETLGVREEKKKAFGAISGYINHAATCFVVWIYFYLDRMGVGGSCTGLPAASSRSEGQQHQAPGDPMNPE